MRPLTRQVQFLPIVALMALASTEPAASSTSFSLEQIMSAPFSSSPIAAPVGASAAWLMNEQGRRNLWIASGPAWKAKKLTTFDKDDGQEIAQVVWAPDASYLLFVRGGDFEMERENPNPGMLAEKPDQSIWSVKVDGSSATKLAEGNGPAISPKGDVVAFLRAGQVFTMKPSGESIANAITLKGSAANLRWSPDGSMLAFESERKDHSFIGVCKLAGKSAQYLDPSTDRDSQPVWSPDNTRIAFLRVPARSRAFDFGPEREGEPWSIRVAQVSGGSGKEVFQAAAGLGSVFSAVMAERQVQWASGDRLVFPWEKTGWRHLYSIGSSGGPAIDLTPGEGEVEHVALSADAKTLFFSANFLNVDSRHLWAVTPDGNAVPKQLTTGTENEFEPAPAADNSALIYLAASYNQKAHAAVRLHDSNRALAPETVPPDFPSATLVKPQPVIITAADGLSIHGQLFLPPAGVGTTKHPALLFFHGGSRRQMLLGFHYMYYYSNAYAMNQYLASKGYVVLSVNYRSGIGYGLNFREALNYGATGASEYNDVVGAGLYLKSRSDVDPSRIGLWGGSYGGYLTALGLARASDLFAAGVDFHGVHDWSEVIQNFVPAYDPKTQPDAAKLAFESSPMASVGTWRSPVLLIHGDDDRNVPFSQTVRLAAALRGQHVEFEQLIFPNEIHDFLLHRDWLAAYAATLSFFERKLR